MAIVFTTYIDHIRCESIMLAGRMCVILSILVYGVVNITILLLNLIQKFVLLVFDSAHLRSWFELPSGLLPNMQ